MPTSRREFSLELCRLAALGLAAPIVGAPAGCAGGSGHARRAGDGWDPVDFALSLWRASAPTGNAALSPINVAAGLAMLALGAKGATRKEITRALGASDSSSLVAALGAYASAWSALREPNLLAASGLWLVQGGFEADYVAQVEAKLGAVARELGGGGGEGREAINAWVAEQTRQQIPALLEEPLDPLTRAMLVSTLYFRGSWFAPFDPKDTAPAPFRRDDGVEVEAQMMSLGSGMLRSAWLEDERLFMVELPYITLDADADPDWQSRVYEDDAALPFGVDMLLILPPEGTTLAEASARLDRPRVDALTAQLDELGPGGTIVQIPRFSIRATTDLIPVMGNLGVEQAFVDRANFGAMTAEDVHVGSMQHAVAIDVDETGTTASAAFAAGLRARSRPAGFIADRPFWYIIRQRGGPWLFMGQVADPSVSRSS